MAPIQILNNFRIAPLFALLLVGFLSIVDTYAQKTWDGGGDGVNWSSANNWNPNGVPASTDAVTIADGINLTVNTAAVCSSFTISGGNAANTITISGANSLNVTNAISIGTGSGNGDNKIIAVGGGTLSAASVTLTATTNNNRSSGITISTGTVNVTGNITMGDSRDVVTFSNTGTLNIGGTITAGGTLTPSTGTVNYNNAGAQTVGAYNYNNLTLSGGGTKTLQAGTTTISGNLTLSGTASTTTVADLGITGNLSIGNGTTFTAAGFALTVTGTTTVGAGTSGILNTGGASTGTKTFTGAVTVNAGGVWDLSGQNPATSFGGGITMNGTTFNNGSGAASFAASQSLLGANAMTFGGSITPAGGTTLTNSNSGTVTIDNIVLTGNFTQGSNTPTLALTNAAPFSGAGTFDASTNTNTVTYTGASPAIRTTTYSNLTINGSGTATIGGATTVNGTMTVTSATTNNSTLTVTTALSGGGTLTQGTGSILNIAGTSGITGLNASTNANTVNYTGAAQTVKAVSYRTLGLSGSATKTMTSVTTIANDFSISGSATTSALASALAIGGNFSISGTATINLGTLTTHTANSLTLGGLAEPNGTWGSSTSAATYKTNTYFSNTGLITVSASSCSNGLWIGTTNTDWNTSSNWCASVIPTAGIDVTIQALPNQPIIGAAGGLANSISILSGATLAITGSNSLAVSGDWTNNGTFTANTSTVSFNGTSKTIAGSSSTTFNNLSITGSGSVTTGIGTTLNGNLSLADGTSLTIPGFAFTVTGTTTVGSGASGSLNISSATGTKTFTGDVTLNSGSTWNETAAATVNFGGSFANNAATFTASTGTHTFSGTTKTLSGSTTIAIPTVTLSGTYTNSGTLTCATSLAVNAALTNNGTITASTALSGSSTLTQGATGALNIGGTITITSLVANTSGNTVSYTGAAQTAFVTTYHHLNLMGSGAKTFATTPTVNGTLSMEGTASVVVTTGVVTYGANSTLQYNKPGSYTATSEEWITPFVATGGIIIKNTGAITTPGAVQIGNNSSVPLNINTGATLTPGANLITLHGDFINSGTLTSGSGGITIAGTTASQSIDGFTTTGTVSLTKTAGTATLTGSANGNGLTINGAGGTLNLGAALTHVFTGTWTRTNGILNGGSSTLKIGGSMSGVGGTFTASTGTVEWNAAGAQTIATGAVTYNNLILSGSGNKTFGAIVTISSNLSVTGTAVADLGTFTHSANTLTLAGVGEPSGSWGSTASAATFKNNIYFLSTSTGIVNVSATSCSGAATWIGSTSTDWNIGTNWCSGAVPTSASDVSIQSVVNQPIIGVAGGLARNISIGTGATLTITGSNSLTVSGDWTNNGTFTPNTSTVTFNGVSKTIAGTSATTFNNLSTSGSASITTGVALTVNGNVNIANNTSLTIGGFATTVTGTTTITGGSGSLTLSSDTGIKTFVGSVSNSGSWTSTAVTTTGNLIFRGGIVNSGSSFSAGGATFNTNAQAISGTTATSFANNVAITGIVLTQSNTSDLNIGGTTTITGAGGFTDSNNSGIDTFVGNVSLAGTSTFTTTSVTTVGNLVFRGGVANSGTSFSAGGATFDTNAQAFSGTTAASFANNVAITGVVLTYSNTGNLTVTGTTTISGAGGFTDSNNSGIDTFVGNVSLSGTSAFTTTSVTTTGNLIFRSGIANSGSSFSAGGATFDTNDQSLTGSTAMSFANVVTISGATVDVTNSNTGTVTLSNTGAAVLTGTAGASWIQGANSTLSYGGSTITNITLTTTTNTPNTVIYTNATAPTTIVNFNSLTYSGGGTLTLASPNISGDLTVSSGTFSPTGTVTLNGSSSQTMSGAGTFSLVNLTLNTSTANVFANSDINISGTLTFSTNRILVVGSSADIILGSAATISGANSSRYIQLDGGTGSNSNLTITTTNSTGPWAITYPIGTSTGGYTPVTIPTVSTAPANNATLSVKAINYSSRPGELKRTFRFSIAGNGNATTFSNGVFAYNNTTDISSGDSESSYTAVWRLSSASGAWTNIATISAPTNQFTVVGGSAATASLATGTYFYTIGQSTYIPTITAIADGNWTSASTWDCNCNPDPSNNLLIPSGIDITITFPGILYNDATDITITVNGTLTLNNSALTLDATDQLIVNSGGQLISAGAFGGTITSGFSIALSGILPPNNFGSGTTVNGPAVVTGGSLPITLLYFTGRQVRDEVLLEWASATEENFDYYKVEKSVDGKKFEELGRVKGGPKSSVQKNYSLVDPFPTASKVYYRLVSVDLDGRSEQFNTIAIEFAVSEKRVVVYPNPVMTGINLIVQPNFECSEKDMLTIHNALGELVLQTSLKKGEPASIETTTLGAGLYIVTIHSLDGKFVEKVILK